MRLVDAYDALLFDLDGVLYRGDETVPGALETLTALRAEGRRLAFVTNNSARTPAQVVDKLTRHGYVASIDEVVTSALATADLLATRGGTAFVVGEEGIRRALTSVGVRVVDGEPETTDHVVVGWDREVTYAKLRTASLLIQRGAHLIATNDDRSFPAPDGMWPGAGAILAVLTTTTGIEAEVIGKPHPPLLLSALRRTGGRHPLVIGDRLETDIAGAAGLGWDSLLVLSGVTSREQVEGSTLQPTFVAPDVSALLRGGARSGVG